MVRAAGTGWDIDVINVDGRAVDDGGDGLQFEEVIVDAVGGKRGVLDGMVDEKG